MGHLPYPVSNASRFCRTLLLACLATPCAAAPGSEPQAVAAKPPGATAIDRTVEVHHRLVLAPGERAVALTLDACGGDFDADLVDVLVEHRVPATIFVTRRWLLKHPQAVKALAAHPQLFAIENHGENHLAPVIGPGVSVYGVPGVADKAALRREVEGGAKAIVAAGLPKPAWFRGATARYDREAMEEIRAMGYRVAGFSVNGDAGATLSRRAVASRLEKAVPGDVILLHMNKPASQGAEGFRDALPGMIARGLAFVTLRGRDVEAVPRRGP